MSESMPGIGDMQMNCSPNHCKRQTGKWAIAVYDKCSRQFNSSEEGHSTHTGDQGAGGVESREGSEEMIIPEP